jgi:hypothetical protein
MNKLLIILFTILLTCFGCSKSIGIHISGDGYDGVIVTKLPAGDSDIFKGFWVPSREQIAEIEAHLPLYVSVSTKKWNDHFKPKPLNEYKRLYIGVTEVGSPLIKIKFYHNSLDFVASGDWSKGIWGAMGGGNSFLHASYDVNKKQFTALGCNADA